MRTQINQKLEESGEKERCGQITINCMTTQFRLKELLRMRLRETGWRDKLKEYSKGITGFITGLSKEFVPL